MPEFTTVLTAKQLPAYVEIHRTGDSRNHILVNDPQLDNSSPSVRIPNVVVGGDRI